RCGSPNRPHRPACQTVVLRPTSLHSLNAAGFPPDVTCLLQRLLGLYVEPNSIYRSMALYELFLAFEGSTSRFSNGLLRRSAIGYHTRLGVLPSVRAVGWQLCFQADCDLHRHVLDVLYGFAAL